MEVGCLENRLKINESVCRTLGLTLWSPCLSLRAQAPLPLNVYKLWAGRPSAWGPHTLHPMPRRPFLGLAGSFSSSAFSRETLHPWSLCPAPWSCRCCRPFCPHSRSPGGVCPAHLGRSAPQLVLEAASVSLCCVLFS